MKLKAKLIAALLSVAVMLSFPVCAQASTRTGTIFKKNTTYTHQTQFDGCQIIQGVDLSKHNGTVDFAKLKAAGVKYVILRAGYRGYGEKGSLCKDVKFDEYIVAAAKQGLNIGIYFYSQAITTAEARAEANYTESIIRPYKNSITLPVAFDYEFAEVDDGRFDAAWHNKTLNKTKCTNIAAAFCQQIQSLGYKPMIYANKSFLHDVIDGQTLGQSYPIWLANYTTNTTYAGPFYIWQFSSTGTVNGISGHVDANFLYAGAEYAQAGFSAAIPDTAYTGKAVTPDFDVTFNGIELKRGIDYYLTFSNNINIGKAYVTVTGINDYNDITAKTFTFNIVPTKAATPVLTKRKVTQLSIKWAAHEDADGYRISYINSGKLVTLANTKDTSITLTNLTGSKDYPIVVQAYKTVNKVNYYGIRSDALNTTTRPARVTGLKTKNRGATYITLKWNKQSGADKYVVYKYDAGKKSYIKYGEVTGGSHRTFKVEGLNANTKYKFKVRAVKVNEFGKTMNGTKSAAYSDFSAPNTPKIKSAVSLSSKNITVKHKKIASAHGYQVIWSTNSNFKSNTKKKTFIGKKNLTNAVTAYSSGRGYYVKVRAYVNRNGKKYYSLWSKAIYVVTK